MSVLNAKDFMELLDSLKADYADLEIEQSYALIDKIDGTGGHAAMYRIKNLKAGYDVESFRSS